MLTSARPPLAITNGDRKFYTLHSMQQAKVFAWSLPDERLKTAVVAFKKEDDAGLIASMIDRHVKQNMGWPNLTTVDNTFILMGEPPGPEHQNSSVEILSWSMDQLTVFCAEAYFDIIVLNRLVRRLDKFNLTGERMSLSLPSEYYAEKLAKLYGLE
jgi:hypothetical protein